jgi:ectoine hydroxylase-related dioxygenase (phytanoyl-CoA dioxygenase family)
MKVDIESYKLNGYVMVNNCISTNDLETVREISIRLKEQFVNENLIGKPKEYGVPVYWKGIDMASIIEPQLFPMYTSRLMFKIASKLLETNHIFLFNDQIVTKLPNEDFEFKPHCDNQYGPNLELAKKGEFQTITCAWILDDFNEKNGPISFLNKKTNRWETPLAKAGSILVWDGNTIHLSKVNQTEKPRRVWLLIYSSKDINTIKSNLSYFKKFHNKKFESK